MIALHLPDVDKAFLYGRVGRGEEVAPDTVHVRATDPASLVRNFDDNILFHVFSSGTLGDFRVCQPVNF